MAQLTSQHNGHVYVHNNFDTEFICEFSWLCPPGIFLSRHHLPKTLLVLELHLSTIRGHCLSEGRWWGIEISLAGSLFVCLSDVCRVHPVSGWHMQPAGWMAHIGWSGPAQLAWLKAAATRFHCRPGWGHIMAAACLQLVSSKFANNFLSDAANGQTKKAKTWWGNELHTEIPEITGCL